MVICPFDMLMPWKALNGMHRCMAQCNREEKRKRRQLLSEEEREVTARDFSAYGRSLEMVTSFKYLGQVISEADKDWPAVVKNLYRARKFCSRMLPILSREGVAPRVSGLFLRP